MCLLLLAACAAKPVPPIPACPPPPPVVAAPDSAVNDMLAYQASLRTLPAAELGKALLELNHPSAKTTLRRAMLLATIKGNGDLGRAQALLDGMNDEAGLKPLAQFLSLSYGDMRRADEAADKLGQQVRDAQRRNEQLNDKLEALKNIERTLSVRPPVSNK